MKRKLIVVGAILAIIIVVFLLSPWSLLLSGTDMQLHRKFRTIAIGEESKEVISLLGDPTFTENVPVGQLKGIRAVHTLGDLSKGKAYSTWYNGSVVVYLVAYDENGRVVATVDGRI